MAVIGPVLSDAHFVFSKLDVGMIEIKSSNFYGLFFRRSDYVIMTSVMS